MDARPEREPEIHKLFRMARKFEASGLELQAGSPPLVWLRGVIRQVEMPPLSAQDLEGLVPPILWPEQQKRLEQGEEVAFLYAFEGDERFRVRVARTGGCLRLSAHWGGAV